MKEIFGAIAQYARAYRRMECLQQGNDSVFPTGDQKTGVIAEFYGKLFAQNEYSSAKVSYTRHSTKGCDLIVKESGRRVRKIEVKAVSAYSGAGRISPVHSGWTHLYLFRLDENFQPVGFWVMKRKSFRGLQFPMRHRAMPVEGKPKSGSAEFNNRESKLAELLKVLCRAKAGIPRRR